MLIVSAKALLNSVANNLVRDWFITSQVPEIAFDIHASAISDVGQVHLVNLIKEIY